jgi:hypothetical protein
MPVRLIANLENDRIAIDLKDGVYRIGRDKPADVVIPSSTVSGKHAELQVSGHDILLRDLGSTNGTFVNGERIRAATQINPKDVVLLGSVAVQFEHPAAAKPAGPAKPMLAGPTQRMEAAREVVVAKMSWPWRYFIAGAEAVIVLLLLFLFIEMYNSSAITEQRTRNNFRIFSEQYVHVLANPAMRPVPSPRLDESLAEPIYVTDPDGNQLFPTPPTDVAERKPTPLIDPKTKKIYESAKLGYFKLPGTNNGDNDAASYPVRSGGDLVGYVIARPGTMTDQSNASIVLITFLAGIVSLIILFFTMRRVHMLLRSHMANLQSKISPLASGFATELPRSNVAPELNGIADEVETAVKAARAAAAQRAGKAQPGLEFAPLIADLVDTAGLAYCFTDSDYRIVSMSAQFQRLSEFERAAMGASIFDAGLNSLQAKQLVQALADARREGKAKLKMSLSGASHSGDFNVTVRAQKRPGTDEIILGIFFEPTA